MKLIPVDMLHRELKGETWKVALVQEERESLEVVVNFTRADEKAEERIEDNQEEYKSLREGDCWIASR